MSSYKKDFTDKSALKPAISSEGNNNKNSNKNNGTVHKSDINDNINDINNKNMDKEANKTDRGFVQEADTGTDADFDVNTDADADFDTEINDNPVRPLSFNEYIGQTKLKENLLIFINGAKKRKAKTGKYDLDHLLFFGPPGLGKTTLSSIIAKELGVNIKTTSGPSIEKTGDVAAILSSISEGDIVFIDEIHRLPKPVAEMLYPAMEDFRLDIVIGEGPSAKSIRLSLPRFTLIGATTRAGLIPSPLRDRFGFAARLEYYNIQELTDIIIRSASIYKIIIEKKAAEEIARRSRGTPRIANKMIRRLRDYMLHLKQNAITLEVAKYGINRLGIDEIGLDDNDKLFLLTLINKFAGGPVGIETLAQAMNDEKGTLEEVIEPYLVSCGLIARTKKGRIATETAYKHFNVIKEDSLFS
ncbi:MAG: Holliday junction branch migration DNA helicase RuvB [bacterium]